MVQSKVLCTFFTKTTSTSNFFKSGICPSGTKAIKTHCVQNPGALESRLFFVRHVCLTKDFEKKYFFKTNKFFSTAYNKAMAIFTKSTSMEHIKKKIVFQTLLSKMHLQHMQTIFTKISFLQNLLKISHN